MIKLVCFLHRRPDVDRETFHRHWAEDHGPLIADLPELARHVARYEQNPRLESDYARDRPGHAEFDGATIMWFESLAAYEAYAAEPLYAAHVAPDEARFIARDRMTWFLTGEGDREIGRAEDEQRARVKRLALVRRRADRSPEAFHAHWSGPHADLVRETPALRDALLADQRNHRAPEDYHRDPDTPWDGLAEQWYASQDAYHALVASEPYRRVLAPDEERFMDRGASRFILCAPPRVVIPVG